MRISSIKLGLAALAVSAVMSAGHAGDGALGEGIASYYASSFTGKRTASGEAFNPSDMTAAHRSLPFGSKVRVINITNGRDVVVRVNDRGPHTKGRIIDLSRAAASKIGLVQSGIARVRLEQVR